MNRNRSDMSWAEIYAELEERLRNAPPLDRGRSSGRDGAAHARRLASAIVRRPAMLPLAGLAALGCVVKLSGCGPAEEARAVATTEAFQAPAPVDAGDDPVVIRSSSTGDAIKDSLAAIHGRLAGLRSAYEEKASIEGDLATVDERLRPLLDAARADCDAILRAAEDLRAQLPIAQAGYASAAASYRQRAEGYRDQDLAEVTRGFAAEFDRLAADTPRRIELTDRFLRELKDAQAFLAETDRCLRDTAAALEVFSAGARAPAVSADARAFRRRLGEFIGVVLDYEERLLMRPHDRAGADPAPTPPTPAAGASPPLGPGAATGSAPPPSPGSRAPSPAAPNDAEPGAAARSATPRTGARASAVRDEPPPARDVAPPDWWGLAGEVTTPSHSFRNSVSLRVP
ncbi:hypothetical protein [Tautonia sociabilis]|uniref:Uncharacterized protein n=1 Tax=Tautonia sociabilis TaxID=2080755 RepID=A0A432MC71_9BACT|nr:hypothetical protein [Tautonia sociabilis]RUL81687.1 hypothetical protein TsocGM_24725 [Tautonia sociabilis]